MLTDATWQIGQVIKINITSNTCEHHVPSNMTEDTSCHSFRVPKFKSKHEKTSNKPKLRFFCKMTETIQIVTSKKEQKKKKPLNCQAEGDQGDTTINKWNMEPSIISQNRRRMLGENTEIQIHYLV